MPRVLLFLISLFITCTSFAQPAWTIYNTTNSGLPQNSVRSIAFDSSCVTWVGTDFGLASFDGNSWTTYFTSTSNIPDNSIRSLAVDHQNNLWVGTLSGGLAKFDGTNWTVFNTSNSGLPDDFVKCLEVDILNNLWIGTIGGLAYFDGTNWTVYNIFNSVLGSNNIGSLYVDPVDNRVAIGTVNGGMVVADSSGWTVYTILNSNIPDNTILGIDQDTSGVLWLATPASGLSAWLGGFAFVTFNTVSSNIASNSLTSINIIDGYDIWVTSNDSGLIRRENSIFSDFHTANSPMPDNFCQVVRADRNDILWIGTQTGVLVRLDPSLLTGVEEPELKNYLSAFPQPATEVLHIHTSESIAMCRLFDLSGKIIYLQEPATRVFLTDIPVNQIKPGCYQLQVVYSSGKVANRLVLVAGN